MADLNSYQVHTLALAIGETIQIDATGEYVGCIKSDGKVKVGVDNTTRQPLEQGLTFRTVVGDQFKSLQIENISGALNEIELAVGEGRITDSRLSLNSEVKVASIGDPVDIGTIPNMVPDVPTVFDTLTTPAIAAGTAYAVAPIANQREIIIQAFTGNTGNIRVCESNSTVLGPSLTPGQSITLNINQTLYVSNATGASQFFTYLRIGG